MFLVLVLYMLWASTFIIGKIILEYMPPILFVATRMGVAGMLLLGYQYFFNRSRWRFEWRDIGLFAQITFFFMYIAFIAEYWALQYVTAAKACLLFNLSPFVTALLAYFLLADRLTKKQWLGLMIGFLGFIPIILQQTGFESLSGHIGIFSMPELFLLISVATSCYGWILIKKLITERSYSSVMVNGITMLAAGVLSLITSLMIEGVPQFYAASGAAYGLSSSTYSLLVATGYIALLVLIAHVICFNLYSVLFRRYSVTFISFAGFTTPLFAALFDWMVFGTVAPGAFYVTIFLVSIGLYLFYQDEFIAN